MLGLVTFIADPGLRASIRLDISEANRDLVEGNWKGATVLAGSALEALLLWALQEHEAKHPGSVHAGAGTLVTNGTLAQPPAHLDEWTLHIYIEVAAHIGIIKADSATQARLARSFRNLIHPARTVRLGQVCDRGTALAAVAAVEFVVRDLTP